MKKQDYYSSWYSYAYPEEERRFVSDETLKQEACVQLEYEKRSGQKKEYCEGGGIPLLVDQDSVFILKDGHTLVQGDSGSKKSRSVARPAIIAAALNGQSMIVTDPKGELSSDPMLMGFLGECGEKCYVLDMRTFDKAGFNFFQYPLELIRDGKMQEASCIISRFVDSLLAGVDADDDFWNDMAALLLESLITLLLTGLAQKENGSEYANIMSVISFISKERGFLRAVMEKISEQMKNEFYNPAATLLEIYKNPDRTYACINSSTIALLKDFLAQENLAKMLSVSSFDIKDAYKQPMTIFLVIPDETSAFDHIAGFLIDSFYQQLIAEYSKTYQNKEKPKSQIHFILDEFCNVKINDMSSKVSASRSREIFFTLIYQSDKQLEMAYEKDAGTIKGNCKNFIFLGSSDYDVLLAVSKMTGMTRINEEHADRETVTVGDLRKMKKCRLYKEALLIRENILYCAKLPDYEQFTFLHEYRDKKIGYRNDVEKCSGKTYLPEHLAFDLHKNIIKYPYHISR